MKHTYRETMKKAGTLSNARGPLPTKGIPQKLVNMTEEEKVPEADRAYGMMRTRQSHTPFPLSATPIDLISLAAKLEAEKKQTRVSINSFSIVKPPCYSEQEDILTERHIHFSEQRKVFDKGEFTICKGRKLGDDFHPLHLDENDLHSEPLYPKIVERRSLDTRNFGELETYCRNNNLKIFSGAAPN
ncbi:hypothetical protein KR038_005828 [Drosophila bunnanda]|nr:hypothetical protein KR038_005828 [Drosophila bunnanda]